jgi:hypothetical protein
MLLTNPANSSCSKHARRHPDFNANVLRQRRVSGVGKAASRDRFYETPFRPKTFRLNFRPQIPDQLPAQNSVNDLLWAM